MKNYTSIPGLTDRRRLPRLNKIRLGIKAKSASGKEYPKETSYFVVPPEVAKVYGNQPTELDVMLVNSNREEMFPVAYTHYGLSKGVKCKGDGVEASERSEDGKTWDTKECPCEKKESGKCKQVGHLMIVLPKVNVGGIYQITTSSINSIIDVLSGMDYVENLIGKLHLIPLKLRRVPTKTTHDGKQRTHYTLQLVFDGNIDYINKLQETKQRIAIAGSALALPAPEESNPELDEVDVIENGKIIDEQPIEELNKAVSSKPEPEFKEFNPEPEPPTVNEFDECLKRAAIAKKTVGDELYYAVLATPAFACKHFNELGKGEGGVGRMRAALDALRKVNHNFEAGMTTFEILEEIQGKSTVYSCSQCPGIKISKEQYEVTMTMYGKPLCPDPCEQIEKEDSVRNRKE